MPFCYQSTGVETRFTNGLDPDPRSRNVFSFHKPETLLELLTEDVPAEALRAAERFSIYNKPSTFYKRLQEMPPLIEEGLWSAQIKAIKNLEKSLSENRPRALIQMATGSGKTFTAVTFIYRLLKFAKKNVGAIHELPLQKLPLQKDLPEGWVVSMLEDVVDILDSQRVPVNAKERENRKAKIPYYGATGQVGWIDDYLFDEELVLLGEDGAPFLDANKQKAYIIRGKSWVNNHAHVLKAKNGIPNAYIKYYLDIVNYQKFVTGTTRFKLNQSAMRQIPIPIAPPVEQKLIVSEIEKQFSRLDEAVAALKRVRASLKRYKASMLKAAVEGKLTEGWRKRSGEVAAPFFETNKLRKGGETPPLQKQGADLPEGWRCAKLVEVAEINPKLSKNISDNVEVSFLPMKAVQEETGMIDLSITKKFEEVKRGYTSFINNDIIFAKITPCMENGKIAIVENLRNSLGFGSTEFHVIRLHEPKSIKYLFYFLLQRDIRKQAQRSMTGTAGQLRVPAKFMQEIAVSLPPIPEQQKL